MNDVVVGGGRVYWIHPALSRPSVYNSFFGNLNFNVFICVILEFQQYCTQMHQTGGLLKLILVCVLLFDNDGMAHDCCTNELTALLR